MENNIVKVLIVLVVVGVGLYLLDHIPMDGTIRLIIRVVAILAVCLWLLRVFGII